jgi:hypothetical protein
MAAIERLIATTSQGELLAGLLWRAPTAGKSRTRVLLEAKSLTSDASHYAQAQAGGSVRYGLFQPRASEEGVGLPKGTLAAAACFSALVGERAPNAALVLAVGASGQRKEDRYFVVCLEDGVPVIDVLSNEIDARNALGGEDRPIWSDNPVAYPNCEPADFAWLGAGADRAARLQTLPVNPWPWVGGVAAAASTIALWGGMQHLHRLDLERKAAQAARAADPLPRYLAALAAQRKGMAADRGGLVAAASAMFAYSTWVPGWSLASAECSARLQACTRDWVRRGGSFDDLRRAFPHDALEMPLAQGSSVPSLDVARTSHPLALSRVDLLSTGRPLRSLQAALADVGAQLQRWRTADVVVDLKPPAIWPRLPEVPSTLRHPGALMAGAVEMHNVPGPFILEALSTAPDFFSWESVRVDIGAGSDARGLLKFSAAGVFYVAAR